MKAINDVSATALVTLKCHAADAQHPNSILRDGSSIKIVERILTEHGNELSYIQTNALRSVRKQSLVTHIALRAKYYDDCVREFAQRNPNGTIVNIGCGLDDRFSRVDNGTLNFFDLDLPDIISFKRTIIPETDRFHFLSTSVFDFGWMDRIPQGPVLLLAEGVFMYCEPSAVKALFKKVQQSFETSEMVCEVFHSDWLKGWRKQAVEKKLRNELQFGANAQFKFGIADGKELESWGEGIEFFGDWSYLDVNHPRLGLLRYFEASTSSERCNGLFVTAFRTTASEISVIRIST